MHIKSENSIRKIPKIVCACFDLKKAKILGFISDVSDVFFVLDFLLAINMYRILKVSYAKIVN